MATEHDPKKTLFASDGSKRYRPGLARELIGMLRENKKWWLAPLLLVLLLLSAAALAGGSPAGPFIYTLF